MADWRLKIVLAVTMVPVVAACAAVLGIEDLPMAVRGDAASDDDTGLVEAPDACDSPTASYCLRTCPKPQFCDDFEGETNSFERWQTPPVVPKPLRSGAFGATLEIVPGGVDRGMILAGRAESLTNAPESIGLVHTLGPGPSRKRPGAILARGRGQLAELSFAEGTTTARRLSIMALGSLAANAQAASIVLYEEGPSDIGLAIQQRSLGGNEPPLELFRASGIPRQAASQAWPEVELMVGSRSILAKHKFPCNLVTPDDAGPDYDAGSDPMVVFARTFNASRCALLVGELATVDWLETPLLFVGVSVSDFGLAKYLFDDISVTYFE